MRNLAPASKPSPKEFVTVRGEKYYVNDVLDLCAYPDEAGIKYFTIVKDIAEIEGLEKLNQLKVFLLAYNEIKEIKGLKHLTNLQELSLSDNQITEIKGLENLTNLKTLYLDWYSIREDVRHLLEKEAQEVVKYYREKARTTKKVA